MTRLMVDIESLSVHQGNALVTQVGACTFDLLGTSPIVHEVRTWNLELGPQLLAGRQVDPATVKFWQSRPAVAERWLHNGLTVECMLSGLRGMYMGRSCGEVWAHGICFDIPNLESLYRTWGEEPPWAYNDTRDLRTIARCFPKRRVHTPSGPLVEHDAADDCVAQVHKLWEHWPESL